MSANVETMFFTRVTPWHGLGTRVEDANGALRRPVLRSKTAAMRS